MLAVAWLRSKWWRGVQCLMHQSVPRSHYDSRLLFKIVSDRQKPMIALQIKHPDTVIMVPLERDTSK